MSDGADTRPRKRGLLYALAALAAVAAIAAGTWSVTRRAALTETGAPSATSDGQPAQPAHR